MLKSVTKVVDLPAPPGIAFAYLAAIENWPAWAIHSVRHAEPAGPDLWRVTTFRGHGQIAVSFAQRWGILDFAFTDSEGNVWQVPSRVVAATTGSAFIRTYSQPPSIPDGFFAKVMQLVDEESAHLRARLLERRGP